MEEGGVAFTHAEERRKGGREGGRDAGHVP